MIFDCSWRILLSYEALVEPQDVEVSYLWEASLLSTQTN